MAAAAAPKGLDPVLVGKAATALLAHLKKESKEELFDDGNALSLVFHLKKIPGRQLAKPVQIALPHSIYNPEDGVELCLFVKDAAVDEVKAKLVAGKVGGFTKVMGVTKLRKKYREFRDRRDLVARFAAFFADDRVIRMMPKLCGKPFFHRSKQPAPVRIDRGDIGATLARARDSTWLYVGQQCVSVRVARANMTAEQVAANILAAVTPAVEAFPKKWRGVQAIYLTGVNTLSLPLFKALPEVHIAADELDDEEDSEGEEEDGSGSEDGGSDEGSEDEDEDEGDSEEEAPAASAGKKAAAAAAAAAGSKAAAAAGGKPAKAGAAAAGKPAKPTTAAPAGAAAAAAAAGASAAAPVAGKKRSRPEDAAEAAAAGASGSKQLKAADGGAKKPAAAAVPSGAAAGEAKKPAKADSAAAGGKSGKAAAAAKPAAAAPAAGKAPAAAAGKGAAQAKPAKAAKAAGKK